MAPTSLPDSAGRSQASFRSSAWFITLVVSYAEFVDSLLYTIVLPVVPFALSDLAGVPEESVAVWNSVLISTYGVAAVLLSPLLGFWVGRCQSKKIPFLCGLITTLATTFMMWFGRSLALQILARVIQGTAASLVYISGSVILIEQAGTEHVAEHMGYISTALSVGGFLGPLLGGAIFDKAGYDAVFGLMMGFIGLDVLLRFVMVENLEAGSWKEASSVMDYESEVEIEPTASPSPAADAEEKKAPEPRVTEVSEEARRDPEALTAKTRRFGIPMVLRLCGSGRMCIALLNILITEIILAGMEAVLAVFVEDVWGWDSLGAGLIFLPLTISSVASPLIGRLADRIGSRWPVFIGFATMCPFLTLMMFVREDTLGQKALLCALLTLIGLGINLALDPLLGEICRIVQDAEKNQPHIYRKRGLYAQAYAMFNTVWHVGYVVGPLWAGLVRESQGWTVTCWSLGLLTGVTAVVQVLEWKRPWTGRLKST